MFHRKSYSKSLLAGAVLAAGLQQPVLGATQSAPTTSGGASSAAIAAPETTPRQDQTYSNTARRWAAANCVAEKRSNTTAGAVIGGLLGAAAGTGLVGRHDRAAGAVLGGATGAVIGNASAPPGCPPAYVVRPVAPVYYAPPPPVWYPAPVYPGVVYAAPGWYGPWAWSGGAWVYRPVHHYWYRPYRW